MTTSPTEMLAAIEIGNANLERLDSAVNAAPGTFTNRYGTPIDNLAKRLLNVGFALPVAFNAGLVVNNSTFTVTYGGDTYSPRASEIPFTTTLTFNPSQWIMHRPQVIEGMPERLPHPNRSLSLISGVVDEGGRVGTYVEDDKMLPLASYRGPWVSRTDTASVQFFDDLGTSVPLGSEASTVAAEGADYEAGLAWISSGDIKHITLTGEETISSGTYVFEAVQSVGKGLMAAWNKPLIGPKSRVRITPDGRVFVPDDPRLVILLLGYGQSVSAGSRGYPVITSTAEYPLYNLMPDIGLNSDVRLGRVPSDGAATVFNPATIVGFKSLVARVSYASYLYGETQLETMANRLHATGLSTGALLRSVSMAMGEGGFAYEPPVGDPTGATGGIKKGTITYDNLVAAVTKVAAMCVANGQRLWLPGLIFRHGESDTSKTAYGTWMGELHDDINADLLPILDQDSPIPIILAQPSSFCSVLSDSFGNAVRGMMSAFLANPNEVILSHASYHLPHNVDNLHLTAAGYILDGEYFMNSLLAALGMSNWKPLHMTSAVLSGSDIVTTWHNPTGTALVFDTITVTERSGTWRGFEYKDSDGGGAPTITGATIDSPTQVTFTLSGAPGVGSTDRILACAMRGYSEGTRANSEEMARACLRDSATAVSGYDGRRLYNWPVHQEMGVT